MEGFDQNGRVLHGDQVEPYVAPRRDHEPVWVAGLTYVHSEDVWAVSGVRPVECEVCGRSYGTHR